jgi:proteasome accessory factor C
MSVEVDAERLLFLIPFVASHEEGVPLAELREMLGVDEKALVSLLEAGSMIGAPGGSPDEYVGMYLDEDRVHVFLPQRFERPVRFTSRELWALLLALAPLAVSPMPALREKSRALRAKLLELASRRAASVTELAPRARDDASSTPDVFEALERAVVERRAVEIEYWSKSRDSVGTRTIEPHLLLSENGAWYVAASDEKTYRVDRVKRATLTSRTFEAPAIDVEAFRARVFAQGARDGSFVVAEDGARRTLDGEVNASVHAYLREGRGRRVLLEPRAPRDAFIQETKALLSRYESER